MKYEDVLHEKTPAPSKKSRYPISIGKIIEEPLTELKFTVVDDDVVGSVVADKESCAAARALCRIPEVEHAWVFRTKTLVKLTSGVIQRYNNPFGLTKAVEKFDDSAGLFPAGEYTLKPLNPSNRREAKLKWNDEHKNRRGGKRPYEYGTAPKPLRKK